jgi:hypothetical protein
LWLPIVLSAAVCFLASFAMHMVLTYHRAGIRRLPTDSALDALRGSPPGVYMFPYAETMKEMNTPAMKEKFERGPVGILTLRPPGVAGLGKFLAQWFVFLLVVGVFVAYVVSRTLPPGSPYLQVFRLAGTVAFLAHAGNEATKSIWGGQPWPFTIRNYIDGLIYALLTAGVFGAFRA